jgi:hypothetical protein
MRQTTRSIDFGWLFVILSLGGFIALGVFNLVLDRLFDQGNLGHASAKIEQVHQSTSRHNGVNYYASFSYQVGRDHFREIRAGVAPATFAQLRQGEQVPIKYLLQFPAWSRIDLPNESRWHWHKDGMLTGMLFFCLAIVLILLRKRRT